MKANIQFDTWHVTDCLHRIGSSVDDGQHGGDDTKEDASDHAADGGDVELVDHQVSLIVHHTL